MAGNLTSASAQIGFLKKTKYLYSFIKLLKWEENIVEAHDVACDVAGNPVSAYVYCLLVVVRTLRMCDAGSGRRGRACACARPAHPPGAAQCSSPCEKGRRDMRQREIANQEPLAHAVNYSDYQNIGLII
ncbi:hypothetical protein ACJJTC_017218 [Scirpophaga incertulas]